MHYLDNSATTPLSDVAKQALSDAMESYGNPSSLHKMGINAEEEVEKVRHRFGIARARSAADDERHRVVSVL